MLLLMVSSAILLGLASSHSAGPVLTILPANVSLTVGSDAQLSVERMVRLRNGRLIDRGIDKDASWSALPASVVAVDSNGRVTGMAVGCATITAFVHQAPFQASIKICVKNGNEFAYFADQSGNIDGFSIDPASGALAPVPDSPIHFGFNPTSIAADPHGRFIFVGDIVANLVTVFAVDPNTGNLTRLSSVAGGNQVAAVAIDPQGKFVYAVNRSSNNVSAFALDSSTGGLSPISGSPFGAGHFAFSMAFHPSGKFAYVANYLANSISIYSVNSHTGSLAAVATAATLRAPDTIFVNPAGTLAFVGTLGTEAISTYAIDPTTGLLSPVSVLDVATNGGPFWFGSTPDGKYLYVAHEGWFSVGAYRLSSAGAVTPVAGMPATGYPAGRTPLSIALDPVGKFVFAPDVDDDQVTVFSINPATGALSPVLGSPFPTSPSPFAVAIVTP